MNNHRETMNILHGAKLPHSTLIQWFFFKSLLILLNSSNIWTNTISQDTEQLQLKQATSIRSKPAGLESDPPNNHQSHLILTPLVVVLLLLCLSSSSSCGMFAWSVRPGWFAVQLSRAHTLARCSHVHLYQSTHRYYHGSRDMLLWSKYHFVLNCVFHPFGLCW